MHVRSVDTVGMACTRVPGLHWRTRVHFAAFSVIEKSVPGVHERQMRSDIVVARARTRSPGTQLLTRVQLGMLISDVKSTPATQIAHVRSVVRV